jgi:hypothetical protein
MCGYCTEGIAFDIAQAEAEDRRYEWLDDGHDLVMEMFVQETSDVDAALALEARFPLSALCRQIEATWGRGRRPPSVPRSGHAVIGGWVPPSSVAAIDAASAEEAACVLERFVAWWSGAPAGTPADASLRHHSDRASVFTVMLPELWTAFAVVRLCCSPERVVAVAQALAKMLHPETPSFEARELWLQRRAALAWYDVAGSAMFAQKALGVVRPELLDYVAVMRRREDTPRV